MRPDEVCLLEVGFIEAKNETIQDAEGSSQQPVKATSPKRPQGPKFIKVPSPEIQQREKFPSTTPHPQRPNVPALEGIGSAKKKGDEVMVPPARDAPTSPVHRRTQSMSMVLTSPPPLDTTHANVRCSYLRICSDVALTRLQYAAEL